MPDIHSSNDQFIEKSIEEIRAVISTQPLDAIRLGENLISDCKRNGNEKLEAYLYHVMGVAYYKTEKCKEALDWYTQSLWIRQKIKDEKGQSLTQNNIGLVYHKMGLWDDALEYFLRALALKEKINDPTSIGTTLINLSEIYLRKSDFIEASNVLYKALAIYEKLNDSNSTAMIFQNIGLAHKLQGDYEYALKMYFQSLEIEKNTNDYIRLMELYNNIGVVYYETNQFELAKKNFQEALLLGEAHNYKTGITFSLINLSNVFKQEKKYNEATVYLERCIELCKQTNNISEQITATFNLGSIYQEMKEHVQAETLLLNALELAIKHQSRDLESNLYQSLSLLYENAGNLVKAIEYHKKYSESKDKLLNVENTKALNELKTKYEVEKKEQESEIHRLKSIELKEALDSLTIEKNRSEELLLNILPYSIANELKTNGKVKARNYEQTTVIFIDVRNFTKHSMTHSPEELVAEIDACFGLFDDITEKYPIEKIKTIGDAYLCVSGIPEKVENNAEVIIMAALDMKAALNSYYKEKDEHSIKFDFRFGVHSGPLIAGVVGKKKFEYDIWGDTVNTAARMEQSGEIGQINISEETYQLVKDKFICIPRGKQEAKNKGMVNMYFVEGRLV